MQFWESLVSSRISKYNTEEFFGENKISKCSFMKKLVLTNFKYSYINIDNTVLIMFPCPVSIWYQLTFIQQKF